MRDNIASIHRVNSIEVREREPPTVWVVTLLPVLSRGGKTCPSAAHLAGGSSGIRSEHGISGSATPNLPAIGSDWLRVVVSHVPGPFYILGGNHEHAKCSIFGPVVEHARRRKGMLARYSVTEPVAT